MTDMTNDRKLEHIDIILNDANVDRQKKHWDAISLKNRALPEIDFADVDTTVHFLGKKCRLPLIISSMTGGDHNVVNRINRNLARAAEETGVAMAVGSQRVLFTSVKARSSFELRPLAPRVPLIANLGGVQLNYGFSRDDCQEAVDVLDADGLYFHLNPLQEVVQPEGDTNFSDLARQMGEIAGQLSVPVILKEVGAGFSEADAELVVKNGIRYIDVAGQGGTSWSRIENARHQNSATGLEFQDWGIPTPVALRLLKPFQNDLYIIASGGIRSGIDMAKAVILGANMCGIAGPFLPRAMESSDQVVDYIHRLQRELSVAMFLLGVTTINELSNRDDLILNQQFPSAPSKQS